MTITYANNTYSKYNTGYINKDQYIDRAILTSNPKTNRTELTVEFGMENGDYEPPILMKRYVGLMSKNENPCSIEYDEKNLIIEDRNNDNLPDITFNIQVLNTDYWASTITWKNNYLPFEKIIKKFQNQKNYQLTLDKFQQLDLSKKEFILHELDLSDIGLNQEKWENAIYKYKDRNMTNTIPDSQFDLLLLQELFGDLNNY